MGSLLLWDISKDPPLDYMEIKGVSLKREDANPTSLILDGQQRVTSIYYALNAPGFSLKGGSGPVYFYIDFQNFFVQAQSDEIPELEPSEIITVLPTLLSREETFLRLLFPLQQLSSYAEWVYGLEDFLNDRCKSSGESRLLEQIRKLTRAIDSRLRNIWDGFEIPYVSLPDSMELYQVTDIFEKINTAGLRLSVFDLLIARLSKYEIELRKLWEGATQRYPKLLDYYKSIDKMPIYILQSVSLCYNKASSCKREDILDIYRKVFFQDSELDFSKVWYEMADYVNRAITKMETLRYESGFGVKDERSLPFEPLIPILAALLKEIDSNEDKLKCYDKLKTWYWSSVFSNAYSGAVDTQLAADFKDMRDWFRQDSKTPKTVEDAHRDFISLDLRNVKSKSSAIFHGVLCLLALQGAKDFDTGQSLENARINDEDHIFPLNHYRGAKYVNSVLNMTWMSDSTNRIIKGRMKPSEYLKTFIKPRANTEFSRLLESHFINQSAFEYLQHDQLDEFIEERQKQIRSKIGELIGFKAPFMGPTDITTDRIFRNEMAFWSTLKQCDEYIHWVDKYFSPIGLQFLYYSMNRASVKDVKILVGNEKANENLRHYFETFRNELKGEGIDCQLRVIADRNVKREIHDRYVISKSVTFNVPSVDTAEMGQYSEIKMSTATLPFDKWWSRALDIITQWNDIQKSKEVN